MSNALVKLNLRFLECLEQSLGKKSALRGPLIAKKKTFVLIDLTEAVSFWMRREVENVCLCLKCPVVVVQVRAGFCK